MDRHAFHHRFWILPIVSSFFSFFSLSWTGSVSAGGPAIAELKAEAISAFAAAVKWSPAKVPGNFKVAYDVQFRKRIEGQA